ncbi:FAD-dependent monooxygenase [Sphingomonas sp. QA11]|uniref:FAD-dependent monooxygenase n=1 Tax=Sphingomonas sp. QA11 TaxID=2950605 RepID=UPI002349C807|nr:FAD-dependent monooxygenase [Sphingomonas sp. QA11]WCM25960.1 FAD-dependent monooxygenase [Sphingomonas sp. QA11]
MSSSVTVFDIILAELPNDASIIRPYPAVDEPSRSIEPADQTRGMFVETARKILICGGGIAGTTCAYWLNEYGYSVVIAERATAFRDGGQNVDIKGAGQHVIEKMGLVEKVEAKNTHELGQKYLDARGRVIAVLPKGAAGTLTSDFEILRGDFAQVLFDAARNRCEYRFGTTVTRLEEADDGMTVYFDDGRAETFALVICAEGVSSATRKLMLAEETRFRYLGTYMAFFKIPRRAEDDGWAWSVNGRDGTFLTLRPGNQHETTVLLTFPCEERAFDGSDTAARKALLVAAMRGRGSIADRVRAELDGVRDFYFGPMSQVRASAWSKSRFVLLGDAAYCPTPFTGAGTALALVGAYVLAGEIKRCADHSRAFGAYEQIVRPYAEAVQAQLTPGFVRMVHPRSRVGIAIAHLVQRALASRLVQTLARRHIAKRQSGAVEDFSLPEYR